MSRVKSQNEAVILPDIHFWHAMKINPKTVLARFDQAENLANVNKFLVDDLQIFFKDGTQSEPKLSKKDLIMLMDRRYPGLLNTLLVLIQYSRFVSKGVLSNFCLNLGLQPGRRTSTQLSLLLFNNKKELLRRARIASVGYRIRSYYSFTSTSPSKKKLDDDKTVNSIAAAVENQLSTSEKRAELVEHYHDDIKGTYRLFVKYEDREQRIEEWDGSHWYKPVDWIVVDYDSKDNYLSLRCRNESRATQMASIVSKEITGKKDAFSQLTLDRWIDSLEIGDVKETHHEHFKVLDHDIRLVKIRNANLKNNPTIDLRGTKLDESINEMKRRFKVDLLKGAELQSFEMKITFEYEGVVDEITIRLRKDERNYGFSKETHEQVKRLLMEYIDSVIPGG